MANYNLPDGEAIYIAIIADEDGVIWARDMVDGKESDKFGTTNVSASQQEDDVLWAVRQLLRRMAE